MSEDTYNNDLLGLPHDYSPAEQAHDKHYIGEQKAKIQIVPERWQDRDHRDMGDNAPQDPEQNWDEREQTDIF